MKKIIAITHTSSNDKNAKDVIIARLECGHDIDMSICAPGPGSTYHCFECEMNTPRSATIESLPGVAWNAHAALGDAMNQVPLTSPVIALWLDENGQVRWSASATNQQIVWMLHTQLKRL